MYERIFIIIRVVAGAGGHIWMVFQSNENEERAKAPFFVSLVV